jgi:hypothetical protein
MSKRANRLAEIRREIAADLGHDTIEAVTGPAREQLELGALLRLQQETVAARLVEGGSVGTDELIKLSEAIAAILPKPQWKPPPIRFIDNGSLEVQALSERLSKSERERYALLAENEQLKRRPSGQGGDGITHQQPSCAPGDTSQAGSNVVPMRSSKPEHSDAYGTLAALNSNFRSSPYIGIDPNDRRDYSPLK